jgi:hypothetical protein
MADPSPIDDSPPPLSGESLPTHSEDGVDLTLISWMLSLTPLERMHVLQRTIRSIQRLRDGQSRT